MKYLFAASAGAQGKQGTTEEDPVVPCFPGTHDTSFLTVPSFKIAARAVVKDLEVDPDEMVDSLAKEYPCLPRKLHENYVFETFKSVADEEIGTEFGVAVNQRQALLINKTNGSTKVIWDKQPIY